MYCTAVHCTKCAIPTIHIYIVIVAKCIALKCSTLLCIAQCALYIQRLSPAAYHRFSHRCSIFPDGDAREGERKIIKLGTWDFKDFYRGTLKVFKNMGRDGIAKNFFKI